MIVLNKILTFLLSILDRVLPSLSVDQSFLTMIDGAISKFIGLIEGASWIVPLNVLVVCYGVMLIADNFTLLSRIGQWVIRTIRG